MYEKSEFDILWWMWSSLYFENIANCSLSRSCRIASYCADSSVSLSRNAFATIARTWSTVNTTSCFGRSSACPWLEWHVLGVGLLWAWVDIDSGKLDGAMKFSMPSACVLRCFRRMRFWFMCVQMCLSASADWSAGEGWKAEDGLVGLARVQWKPATVLGLFGLRGVNNLHLFARETGGMSYLSGESVAIMSNGRLMRTDMIGC